MTFKIVSKICASNHLIYELSWSTLAWKKALIRSHWLEITSQTLSKIYLFSDFFQAASQKWTVKPTVWCIGICSICWFFAKRLIWVGLLSKLWTFISNQRCQFGPISMIQFIFDTFCHLAFDAQILKTILTLYTPLKKHVFQKLISQIY